MNRSTVRLFRTPRCLVAGVSALLLISALLSPLACVSTILASPRTVCVIPHERYFGAQILTFDLGNSCSSGPISFSIGNGTQLWYSVAIDQGPDTVMPQLADANDVVNSAIFGHTPDHLLPPTDVLPYKVLSGYRDDKIYLQATFSASDQRVQFRLTPFTYSAVALDAVSLILNIIGTDVHRAQLGLVGDNGKVIADILKDVDRLHEIGSHLDEFITDFIQLKQDIVEGNAVAAGRDGLQCAKDLFDLLRSDDGPTQSLLRDIIWKVLGKTVAQQAIQDALKEFTGRLASGLAQVILVVGGFIRDELLAMGSVLFTQGDPTVTLIASLTTPGQTPTRTVTTAPAPTQPSPASQGTTASYAIASIYTAGNQSNNMYAYGSDGALWEDDIHTTWKTGWYRVPVSGFTGSLVGAPVAILDTSGLLEVFGRDRDGSTWYFQQSGSRYTAANLGGVIIGDPNVAINPTTGTVSVVGIGSDHNLWEIDRNIYGWNPSWHSVNAGAALFSGRPLMMKDGWGNFEFFVHDVDGNVWWNTSKAWGWHKLGNPGMSSFLPNIGLYMNPSTGTISIFVNAADGKIYQSDENQYGWNSWYVPVANPAGISFNGSPIAGVNASKTFSLFVQDSSGALWKIDTDSSFHFQGWVAMNQGAGPHRFRGESAFYLNPATGTLSSLNVGIDGNVYEGDDHYTWVNPWENLGSTG